MVNIWKMLEITVPIYTVAFPPKFIKKLFFNWEGKCSPVESPMYCLLYTYTYTLWLQVYVPVIKAN